MFFAEDQSGEKADDHAEDQRQQYDQRDHIGGKSACWEVSGDSGDDSEEYDAADDIIQSRHWDQGLSHRAVCFKFPHDGERRSGRCSKRDTAEEQGKIQRNTGKVEYNPEYQGDDKKSTQWLSQCRDDDRSAGAFDLVPHKLRTDHKADCTFQDVNGSLIPCGVQDFLAHQGNGMRAKDHAGDQPSEDGWQFGLGDQFADQKCDSNRKNKAKK